MRRARVMLVLLALLAGCGTASAAAETRPPVLSRTLVLARGADRPLPTTVWFPSGLTGRHPIVLFSHGLGGLPAHFEALATGWATAGYVVAAPAFPHTRTGVRIVRDDIANQPADLAYVLTRVTALDTVAGDPFAGHLDTGRVAAVGFSAGGTTTLGLLRAGHDRAIRAAISVAGRRPDTPLGGPAVPVLFVHGDRDPVVPIAAGRRAYAAVPWTKRFVTIPGEGHGPFLRPGDPAYPRVSALILEFLRACVPAR